MASSSFTVTGGAATSISFVQQPSNVVAGVSMSPAPTVQVQDQFGNPVSGAAVTLGVSSGSLTSGFSGSTGTNGVVSFGSLKINTAAVGLTLTATTGALTSPVSSAFNVTAAAANKLAYVQAPSAVSAGVAMTPAVTVQVQDQFGNPAASNGVLVTLTATGGSIASGNTASTNSSGLATFSVITINTAGNMTITASATSLASVTSSTFPVSPGPANKLGFVQQPQASVVAGVAMSPSVTVQVQDQFGNAVSTNGVSITVAPSSGSIASGATASTNGSGLASFPVVINTAGTGLTLSASSTTPAFSSGSSTSFAVVAAAQKQLVFLVGPSNVVAGANMSPAVKVQAQDQFGNPVSTSGTTITLVPSSGTINAGSTANTSSGVATFSGVQINTAATGLTLTATASGLTTAGPSASFNVIAGNASKLAFAQGPSNVAAGANMTPSVTVRVQDSLGNTVTTDNGRVVTLNVSSGTIDAGSSTTTSAGIATFSGIQINTAATGLTLTSLSSGLTTTPASSAFNVSAAGASKLVFGQQPTDAVLGATITPPSRSRSRTSSATWCRPTAAVP